MIPESHPLHTNYARRMSRRHHGIGTVVRISWVLTFTKYQTYPIDVHGLQLQKLVSRQTICCVARISWVVTSNKYQTYPIDVNGLIVFEREGGNTKHAHSRIAWEAWNTMVSGEGISLSNPFLLENNAFCGSALQNRWQ